MAQHFKAGQVFAFEPMASNLFMLAENLELGGCASKVTIMPFAVGDEDGTVNFQVDDLTSNSGSLDSVMHGRASRSRSQYGLPPKAVQVPISRLDTLIATGQVPVPAVIKVDVEGAEALVVKGATRLLSEHAPRMAFELHGPAFARDTLQSLWDVSYRCFGYLNVNGNSAYREILPADLPHVAKQGSLRLLVAAKTAEELEQPIQDFSLPS